MEQVPPLRCRAELIFQHKGHAGASMAVRRVVLFRQGLKESYVSQVQKRVQDRECELRWCLS